MTALLQVLDQMSKQMQPFQIKHWWLLGWKRTWCRCVGGPNDQVGISTATDTDDLYLLTIQRMMGMSDGHPSRNSWG